MYYLLLLMISGGILLAVRECYMYLNQEDLKSRETKTRMFATTGLAIINASCVVAMMSVVYLILVELLRNVFCLIK